MRWWAAVPLAVVVAVAGAVADLRVEGALGWGFGVALVAGCLVAVLALSGPGLAAVMVQPPVVALLAVGVATVLTGSAVGGSATVLAIGTRLTAEFPLVAGVTGATVLAGLVRRWRGRSVARA